MNAGDDGYSTVMDALIFLSMVSLCALILSPALTSTVQQEAAAGYGMRAMAASSLVSLQDSRAGYFEYRLLGDVTDSIAISAGIDPDAWLYESLSGAVLGRGQRHKTVMCIAAENAASQFLLNGIRLGVFTGDYDRETCSLIDDTVRKQVDDRFSYAFVIRWTPLADVPFGGSISAGETPPAGASSSGCYVTMPYLTSFNRETLEETISDGLDGIAMAVSGHLAGGDDASFDREISESLDGCMEKTAEYAAGDLWNITLGKKLDTGDAGDPYAPLKSFGGNDTAVSFENPLPDIIKAYNAPALDRLVSDIATGVDNGSLDADGARDMALEWMLSRYTPSRAKVSLYVWVNSDAPK